MSKLIFGCGYLGLRVARSWREGGEDVVAVTRSEGRAGELEAEGLGVLVADVNDPTALGDLPRVETVLFAVGYDRKVPETERRSIGEVYAGGLKNVLDALPESVERVIYISSTGVYGDSAGDWVDEDSLCEPQREGGRACLAAEEVLWEHPLGDRGIVLRLAGIYGPGRVPRLREIERGEPIEASADGMLNLIHVDDAARVVLGAEARANAPRTFCVSDGQPVLRRDWFRELARLSGLAEPEFVEPDPSKMSRGSASKRIRNERMMAELQPELVYPSYREGLKQVLATSNRRPPSDERGSKAKGGS